MDLGAPELLIILAVVFLLFGAKKLPDLAKSLGQAKREFRDAEADPAAVAVGVPVAPVVPVVPAVPVAVDPDRVA